MLSDSCFDFILETARGTDECKTAARLLADTRHYIKTLPWIYGPEIDLLREAVEKFLAEQTPETRAHLWRTARLVQIFHDRSPLDSSVEFETWAGLELETRPEDYEWRKIRRRYLNL